MQTFASASVGLNLHARANVLMATEGRSRRFSCMSALTGPRLERSAATYTLMMGMFEAACVRVRDTMLCIWFLSVAQ